MVEKDSIEIIGFDKAKHHDQVSVLWRRIFGYKDTRNDPGFAIEKKLAVGDGLFWVAVCKGTVVGTIMAGYDGHRGWIYSMAVAIQHQNHGIGSLLLGHVEKQLTSLGCAKINLQIVKGNDAVQEFYQANGFVVEDRLSMGKQIDENVSDLD